MACLVCQSKRVSPRIQTARVHICRHCITLLSTNSMDPNILLREVNRIIDDYASRTGKFQSMPYSKAEALARQQLKTPGALKGAMMSLFAPGRHRKLKQLTRERTAALLNQHQAKLAATREHKRREIMVSLMDWRNSPKVIDTIDNRKGDLGYKALISPTRVKFFNAIKLGLISGDPPYPLPASAEWYKLVEQITAEDGFRCCHCGDRETGLQVRHIIAPSAYGTNNPANMVALCYRCRNQYLRENADLRAEAGLAPPPPKFTLQDPD